MENSSCATAEHIQQGPHFKENEKVLEVQENSDRMCSEICEKKNLEQH